MLSFGVLIAFWSPKQYEIEESSLESMQGVYPDRASGYTIGGHPDHISGQELHPAATICTRMCATIYIRLSRTSTRMFMSEILTPDRKGERFNFSWWTYLDPLIAPTRRVSQTILYSAAVFSWSFLIFATDILGYFEIFYFRYLLSKSPKSPCSPPIIGFLSYLVWKKGE